MPNKNRKNLVTYALAGSCALAKHFYPNRHNVTSDFKSNLICKEKLDKNEEEYLITYQSEE